MKYVHPSCLQQWRTTSQNPIANTRCETCHKKYHLAPKDDPTWGLCLLASTNCAWLVAIVMGIEIAILCLGWLGIALAKATETGEDASFAPGWRVHSYGLNICFVFGLSLAMLCLARRTMYLCRLIHI